MKRLWLLALGVALVGGIIAAALLLRPKPLIPGDVKNQVTTTIFVPSDKRVQNKPDTAKYDSKLKLLSYQSAIFGVNATISEQPTPDSFVDIPQVYQKVLDSWKQYDKFDTANGTVYLTRPNKDGKTVGVMNSKGTLMFVKPDRELTDDQWHQFFKSLQIQ